MSSYWKQTPEAEYQRTSEIQPLYDYEETDYDEDTLSNICFSLENFVFFLDSHSYKGHVVWQKLFFQMHVPVTNLWFYNSSKTSNLVISES